MQIQHHHDRTGTPLCLRASLPASRKSGEIRLTATAILRSCFAIVMPYSGDQAAALRRSGRGGRWGGGFGGERVEDDTDRGLAVAAAAADGEDPAGDRVSWAQQPDPRRWAGSAVALAGTALIAAAHGLGFGAAALVVLGAAIAQGVFHTAQKPLLSRYTGFEVTVYAMWAGTIFILPWSGSLLRALPHAGAPAIASAVFLGVAPSAVGFVLWAYAMSRMDVSRVTVSLYLVPAAAILISLAWLSQIPGPVELAGGAVALGGVMLASTRSRRTSHAGDQRCPSSASTFMKAGPRTSSRDEGAASTVMLAE